MRIAAVILAAGASRRLGQPKQLVRIQSESLLERTLHVVREAGIDAVFVVLGAHADRIEAEADLRDVALVRNAQWETGMASSIHAGMNAMQEAMPGAEAVLLLVCDQVHLTSAHLRRLLEAAKWGAIVASAYEGVPGVPAILPSHAFPQLMELRGDAGARSLLKEDSVIAVDFEDGVIDLDTEEDLRRIANDPSL
jgi:CTP:molybdopterin cytidylyltransferase MocA